ncbi:hypothetical protein Y032_0053g2399 [Ancylostoma ceylanicum]|nr:hypothetical protein Y032_0053g2399 [Ancylostoma ceylanicum]
MQIEETPINSVDKNKDLGFFDQHCEQIAAKAMGIMVKLFEALPTRNSVILLLAFKTYVRPLLEYGTVIFCPYKRKLVEKLEKVQNNSTRKLLIRTVGFMCDKIPSAKERKVNLSLNSLSRRRRRFDPIPFHKLVRGSCGLDPEKFLVFRPSITKGGALELCLPRARLKCRSHFFLIGEAPTT